MNKLAGGALVLGMAFGAVACGGVDKSGTANNLIAAVEKAGTTLDATAKTCVTDLVKSYNDTDLKAIFAKLNDPTKPDSDKYTEFTTKVTACIAGSGGGSTDTTAEPATT